MKKTIIAIWNFYLEGFKNMTWGRTLWFLIILKIVILFLVLRVFFFKPVMSGKTDEQKSEYVGTQLIRDQELEIEGAYRLEKIIQLKTIKKYNYG